MDVITHVMIGAAATSPWWASHPLECVAFTFGSVLPDVDALSRQFSKVAFLRAHQGLTHAIPVQLLLTLLGLAAVLYGDLAVLAPSVILCGLGAMIHTFFDYTNTYGVRLWAPFDRRRRSAEWIFFIDAGVIALCCSVLCVQSVLHTRAVGTSLAVGLFGWAAMCCYIVARAALRRRAASYVPGHAALIPSALSPWRFYGLALDSSVARTFEVNALNGTLTDVSDVQILQGWWTEQLNRLPEFAAMSELTMGFRVVGYDGTTLECRDLRTRNTFGTAFGRLLVCTDGGKLAVERFDV